MPRLRGGDELQRMRYRTFGRTGWQVSEIGYGMWGMGGWTGSDDDAIARIASACGRPWL